MKQLKPENIIPVIEEYRKAYLAAQFPSEFEHKRYRAEVVRSREDKNKLSIWTVNLIDLWIEMQAPNEFRLGRAIVPNSTFRSPNLSLALEELLNFVRMQNF